MQTNLTFCGPTAPESWFDIAAVAELEATNRLVCDVKGVHVVVVRVEEGIFGFEDRCTHEDVPLVDADIEGQEIICPFHRARFCLRTGRVLWPPAIEPLRVFTIHEANERLFLAFD